MRFLSPASASTAPPGERLVLAPRFSSKPWANPCERYAPSKGMSVLLEGRTTWVESKMALEVGYAAAANLRVARSMGPEVDISALTSDAPGCRMRASRNDAVFRA